MECTIAYLTGTVTENRLHCSFGPRPGVAPMYPRPFSFHPVIACKRFTRQTALSGYDLA
jgi:hypothetical protein